MSRRSPVDIQMMVVPTAASNAPAAVSREAGRREPPLVPHGRSLAPGDPWSKHYDCAMAPFMRPLREHVGNFFTNWSESDLPVARKVALTLRNRAISVVNKGCCGHHGEPGC